MLLFLILSLAAGSALAKDKVEYDCSDLIVKNGNSGRVGGEDIASAVTIPGLPFVDGGNTSAFFDDYDVACPYGGSTSPDVVYAFTPPYDMAIDADLCASSYDTKMYIADSALNVIDCNDDSCPGYMSELFDVALIGGETYYIFVDGYGGDSGEYVLNITEDIVLPPEDGETCDIAIPLTDGIFAFDVDLCLYNNDYSTSYGGCTGWSANGPEAVYIVELAPGGIIEVCEDGGFDLAIYLVTDCDDIDGSCVAGDDSGNPECISYTSAAGGTFYLMVDAYSGCGLVSVAGEIVNPVGTESSDWSTVKALY